MAVAVLATVSAVGNGAAQSVAVSASPWHAQWITAPDLRPYDPAVLYFQRAITLSSLPAHFIVYVSADNAFLLHVNGRLVGRGPARGDLAHWRFEMFDLAPFLHEGNNIIASAVWNFGEYKAAAQVTDRTAFLLQGVSPEAKIVDTDEAWKVELDHGIVIKPVTPKILRGYYAAEPIEVTDAKHSDPDWDSFNSDPDRWIPALSLGEATPRGFRDSHNNWQLIPDTLPPMESTPQSGGKVVRCSKLISPATFPDGPLTVPAHTSVSVLLDNLQLTTAYPEIALSGGKGTTIRLTYAEALQDKNGLKGNRGEILGKTIAGVYDEYVTDGSDHRIFAPLVWRTWRYLQIDISTAGDSLKLDGFRSVFSAYPFVERARFVTDDPTLSLIWNIGWRTARVDAHDTYMDTAYWERLQYVGDTRIQALISYVVADDDRLARQAIEAINESRIPEGITLSRYPTSTFQAIPPFSLIWVGLLHDFAIYRDDPAFVRGQLAGSRAVLAWFFEHQNSNGMIGILPWWSFVDYASDFVAGVPPQDAHGDSTIITLHFVEALQEAADLEDAYGDPSMAKRYRLAAVRIIRAVRSLCWNSKYRLFADTPGGVHFSQHANAMAVWLDVAPRSAQRRIMTRILSVPNHKELPVLSTASYYYRFYLARGLLHAGMGDEYLRQLQPWRDMAALGLTTWAEKPEPARSDSHAWSAHPNFDLLTIVAGIQPASLGFRSVLISPHLGTLRNVSVSYPHPKGTIDVTYIQEPGVLKVAIHLPRGLPGTFFWRHRSYSIPHGHLNISITENMSHG